MSKTDTPRHDPIPIGEIVEPPFVRLPDPTNLFAARARRCLALAEGSELGEILRFFAALAVCQHRLQADLPEPDMPSGDALARARAHAMPPLDRNRMPIGGALEATLARLLAAAIEIDMPPAARAALDRVADADAAGRAVMVRAALAQAIPAEAFAEHVYVAAALQVHLARQAARLEAATLVPVGDGVCPVCGGAPVASVIAGWRGAQNARFCVCSLCASWWHTVRIKCVLCGSTKGIAYQELAGDAGVVKAETCESCHGYVKILHQQTDPALDPVADDVATLGLDLLLRENGYRRGAVNMFLLGY